MPKQYDQATLQAHCFAMILHCKHCKYVPQKTCLCYHRKAWKKYERYEGWSSFPPVVPHVLLLHNCLCHCPCPFLQECHEAQVWTHLWEQYINNWLLSFDPSQIMQVILFQSHLQQDSIDILNTKVGSYCMYLLTLDNPSCFNAHSSQLLLIINLGGPICISLLCLDFVTYNHIMMKIKDSPPPTK
jgi:hypothetical protein